jgi:hypothetical protein
MISFLGLSLDAWTVISSAASAFGTCFAAAGLYYTSKGIRQNSRTMELQVQSMELQILESVFRDVRELDREYLTEFDSWTNDQKNAWSASFFNTIEYLCFIVNSKIVANKALKEFFFTAALPAWKAMLQDHQESGFLPKNQEGFPEFRKACEAYLKTPGEGGAVELLRSRQMSADWAYSRSLLTQRGDHSTDSNKG